MLVYSRRTADLLTDRKVNMDEAEILNGIKIEILRDKRVILVQNLNPERHFDYLRSRCVLSSLDCEEIMHKVGRERQASLFLDKLLDHGSSAYDRLCESLLSERTQMFLLRMLNMEYENKKNNCRALFRRDINRDPAIVLSVVPDDLPLPQGSRSHNIKSSVPTEDSSA